MSKNYVMDPEKFAQIASGFRFPPDSPNYDNDVLSPNDNLSTYSSNSQQSEINPTLIDKDLFKILYPMFMGMFELGERMVHIDLDTVEAKNSIIYTVRKAIEIALNPDHSKLNDSDITQFHFLMQNCNNLFNLLTLDNLKIPTPNLSRRNSVTDDLREFIKKVKTNELDDIAEEEEDANDYEYIEIESVIGRLSRLSNQEKELGEDDLFEDKSLSDEANFSDCVSNNEKDLSGCVSESE